MPVTGVVITPATANLQSGAELQLVARVTGRSGSLLSDRVVIWRSSDEHIATVSSTGLVRGQMNRAGQPTPVIITAHVEGITGQASLDLLPVPVSSIRILDTPSALESGGELALQARTLGSDGEILTGRTVLWSSSDTTRARISTEGIVEAQMVASPQADTVTITATAESVSTSRALAILPAEVMAVRLALDSVMIRVGESIEVEAQVLGAGDLELTGRPVTWRSLDTAIAQVSATGRVSAGEHDGARFRSTWIVAEVGAHTDTLKLVVQPRPPTLVLRGAEGLVRVGETAHLQWQGEHAHTCQGSGLFPDEMATAGEQVHHPEQGGRRWAGIACIGDGGEVRDSLVVVTPFPVLPTSYENYREYTIPPAEGSPHPLLPACAAPHGRGPANARVYADFLQNGTLTQFDYIEKTICFWERTQDGLWVDISNRLVANRYPTGCQGSEYYPEGDAIKALVADFNGDQRPDIFIVCYRGESMVMLSGPDGMYTTHPMGFTASSHAAAAGDISGNGFPDILMANDQWESRGRREHDHAPFDPAPGELDVYLTVFVNDGSGQFTRRDDLISIPDSLAHMHMRHNPDQASEYPHGMDSFTTIELIDLDGDGALEAVLGAGNYPITVFWGHPRGGFSTDRPITRGPWSEPNVPYNGVHAFHHVGPYLYAWHIWHEDGLGNSIQRIDTQTWEADLIWTRFEGYLCDEGRCGAWRSLGRIQFHDGKFMSDWIPGLKIDP